MSIEFNQLRELLQQQQKQFEEAQLKLIESLTQRLHIQTAAASTGRLMFHLLRIGDAAIHVWTLLKHTINDKFSWFPEIVHEITISKGPFENLRPYTDIVGREHGSPLSTRARKLWLTMLNVWFDTRTDYQLARTIKTESHQTFKYGVSYIAYTYTTSDFIRKTVSKCESGHDLITIDENPKIWFGDNGPFGEQAPNEAHIIALQ
ncbi:hypothetical protein CLF_108301 [Clonorchis sinensis]|uniref:Uncharacterized protein n=1 Tax=Clonorchis sinensis TaxID=79923 RepID=G7YHV7_CLOSI|nr:hypothetical protein CLF_108301 [Clonorchis sinensis]